MPNNGSWDTEVGIGASVTIPKGYHDGTGVAKNSTTNRGAWSGTVAVNGSVTIPAGYHNGSGKVTNSVSTMNGQTITPKASQQTVSCSGKYMNGNIVIQGDADLVASNIKQGKNIFGISGSCREYRVYSGSLGTAGSKSYTYSADGSTRKGTMYYVNASPGFTPAYAFAAKNNDGSSTCMDTTWGDYLVHSPSYFRNVNKSTNSIPFTSSSTQLVVPSSGTYGVLILGYS